MIKDRRFALAFRAASMLFALVNLLSAMGVLKGKMYQGILMYYTMQSNILVILLFGALAVRTGIDLRKERIGSAGYFARFEMVCVIDILLTFVVYWTLLAPGYSAADGEYSLWSFDNLAVHGITPLLCLLDYAMFSQPRHLKYRDIYCVLIFPFAYVAATSLAGLLGYSYMVSPADGKPVRFPYFFFDFDRIGLMSLIYIGVLVAFFLIIAHFFYLIDKKIRKIKL